jgi:hypothetical protein
MHMFRSDNLKIVDQVGEELSTGSLVHLEKLIVPQIAEKFSTFMDAESSLSCDI